VIALDRLITDRVVRYAGLLSIVVSVLAWSAEWSGATYVCPYCRVQRTVIGVLGLLMILPRPGNWLTCYLSLVLGGFAFVVGASQHFMGWKKVSAGTFKLAEEWYFDPMLLSGCAMFILVGQVLLLQQARQARTQRPA
jgi:hypothetical protein